MRHGYNGGTLFLGVFTLLAATSPGAGDDFAMPRFTIDSGGTASTAGGDLELSGTIGQHDAGAVLSGGSFELTGGFWFGQAPCDCNQDGGINLFDFGDFEACLFGPAGGVLDPACVCFDLDLDDDVDLADLGEFQRLFSGF